MSKSALRRVRPSLESLESRALLSTVHLTVNTLADDPSGPVAGQTTLRDAITAADSGSTTDKYVIKFAVDGTIALTAPLPDLTGNIDIKGPGAANLTVSAADLVNPSIGADNSIFIVNNNATAEINGLTLSDAQSGPPNGGSPGAIGNYGIVLIKNCVFSGNGGNGGIQETATNGGGLFNAQTATATIQNSTFINDIANDGGAICNWGTLSVRGCTFSNDHANVGGAIINFASATITQSNFSANSALAGGAIYAAPPDSVFVTPPLIGPGFTDVKNCVFSDNSGGAMFVESGSLSGAIATITDSDFIDNSSAQGGAVYNGGTITMNNDAFSGNVKTGGEEYGPGGNAILNMGVMTLTASTFSGNGVSGPGSDILNVGTATIGKHLLAELGTGIYNGGTIN